MSRDASAMDNLEKLRVLLPHWIEHNIGHGREFEKWAGILGEAGDKEVAGLLRKAHSCLQDADVVLREALARTGGSMGGEGHHHHHHDH